MKFVIYISISLLFINCSSSSTNFSGNKIEKLLSKNNVTSSIRYKTIFSNGIIYQDKFKLIKTEYNDNGQPLLMTTYTPNGVIESIKSCIYDTDSNPIEILTGNSIDDLKVIMRTKRIPKKNIEILYDYRPNGDLLEYTEYEINEKGLSISGKAYNPDSVLIKIFTFNYDSNDHLINTKQYDSNEKLEYNIEKVYTNDNLISEKRYYNDSIEYIRTYKYNKSNMIIEDFLEDFDIGYTVKFIIEYNEKRLEKTSTMTYEAKLSSEKLKEVTEVEYQYK